MMPAMCGGESKRRQMSPFFGPVKGLCPLHISYSTIEVVTDECRSFAKRAKAEGVEVREYTADHLMHAFQLFFGYIPEAKLAMVDIVVWLGEQLRTSQSQGRKNENTNDGPKAASAGEERKSHGLGGGDNRSSSRRGAALPADLAVHVEKCLDHRHLDSLFCDVLLILASLGALILFPCILCMFVLRS
mmetsp:Transcript_28772/g.55936  ORF Transcript_28772/g.55936 Transcript_28772/m.55936 type:complete len:188 (+) Transcript_28772:138-701(+)